MILLFLSCSFKKALKCISVNIKTTDGPQRVIYADEDDKNRNHQRDIIDKVEK